VSKTIIVVPCHDESRRFNVLAFRQFAARHPNVHFLLVNDGSRDKTLSILQQLATLDPNHFDILDCKTNGGKAEAVRLGVLQAATESPEYVGFWDADLAAPLDAIPEFIAVLDRRPEVHLLLGVRIQLLGHTIRRHCVRRLLGKTFAKAASAALGLRFHDTQCGAKIFRASPQIMAAFSQPFDSRWIFDVELLARLIRMRRETASTLHDCVYEYPLDFWEDIAGSKLKRGDFFKAVAELSTIWWRYLRPAAPPYVAAAENPVRHSLEPTAPRRAA
jgi:dolichyl-phosphate beta-glucosyltransferase